ncbi:hypothetical protein SASPL_105773 [Salvia splendens]|uniref:Transcription factor CBF/NF-Y/archaeal histone domain-containing protein n=1 Tax=Salvia splendens TaxID=180675 RepID=A0A8X8YKK6_SALSN|nr:hypothetical protein SASPL_105773 [Salvia splendens]
MAEENDRLLPVANVWRMMKKILPQTPRSPKKPKKQCTSEFICFVTGEASDRCHKENRKTVNGDDIPQLPRIR